MDELNICILPSNDITNLTIKLSQQLSKNYSTEFVLNQKDCIPHLSLYHVGIPKKNYTIIISKFEKLIKSLKSFHIDIGGYKNLDTFLFWSIKKTEVLINFQNQIIKKVNPIREGMQRMSIDEWKNDLSLSDDQLINVKKFGYPMVEKCFDPHITITRFKDIKDTMSVIKSLDTETKRMRVEKVSIGLIGPHGTLPKILNTFKLKQ